MTEEIFNNVVELNDKLTQLKVIQEEVGKCCGLTYMTKNGRNFPEFNKFPFLTQILRSHEFAIMEELNAEINEIKQQISRL